MRVRAVLGAVLLLVAGSGAIAGSRALAGPPDPVPAPPPTPAAPSPPPKTDPDVEMFSRAGCRHCADARAWLATLARERPTLRLVVRDVNEEDGALERLEALAERTGTLAVAAPSFYVRGKLVVGWVDAASTGRRIVALLDGRAVGPGEDGEGCELVTEAPCDEDEARATVTLPLLGTVRAKDVGLPLFTAVVGLVDGFNPCAMWVLLFLLSLLVNLKSRPKMFAVAGTFIAVSGLVYFAFMAAWLNVFLLVGWSRGIQVVLGILALLAGSIHVKDFFAFHRGVTLSIPEAAKPGIAARASRVLSAPRLGTALAGVAVLALLVNTVELLCTAGLPAVYTQVLTSHHLPRWQYYAYLALYQVFYMLDDSVMLVIAIVTLSKRRLQERGGRALKLVSGAVMVALGMLLLFRPEWLHFG